jgi:hypothetical protein
VLKIVINSGTPVRIEILNAHSFYVNIVLATPVSTAKSECCFSVLRRVKTYLIKQDQLNTLLFISIGKDIMGEILQFN